MHFTPITRCFQSAVNHVCVRLFARETIGLESEKVKHGRELQSKVRCPETCTEPSWGQRGRGGIMSYPTFLQWGSKLAQIFLVCEWSVINIHVCSALNLREMFAWYNKCSLERWTWNCRLCLMLKTCDWNVSYRACDVLSHSATLSRNYFKTLCCFRSNRFVDDIYISTSTVPISTHR